MRLLLAGASGFIGRHLVERLRNDHEVYAMSRTPFGESFQGEVCRWDATERLDPASLPAQVDVVCYLATSRQHRAGCDQADDLFGVNVAGVVPLLSWARESGARQFVYVSTGSVYGAGPAQETSLATPIDFYGASKLAGETVVAGFGRHFGVFVPRLYTPYGPGQADRLVPGLIDRIVSGRPVELHGEFGFWVQPTYVDDIVRIMVTAIEENWNGVTNVAGPDTISLRDLATEIGTIVGRPPEFVTADPDSVRPPDQRPDRQRLSERLGSEFAWTDRRDGLAAMWETHATS